MAQEKKENLAEDSYLLERRRNQNDQSLEVNTSTITSLKRFQKHVNNAIKICKRTCKPLSLAKVSVLEAVHLQGKAGSKLAKQLDAHCKKSILSALRKTDRLYSSDLGHYFILMANTDESQANQAIKRITESLASTTFSNASSFVHPSSVYNIASFPTLEEVGAETVLSKFGLLSSLFPDNNLETAAIANEQIFVAAIEDWLERYEINSDGCQINGSENLKVQFFLGEDSWARGKPVMLRVLKHESELSYKQKLSVMHFLRQVQSLSNPTVVDSRLLDFHLADNKIYLVNSFPQNSSSLSLFEMSVLPPSPQEILLRKLGYKLTGAISYLRSLVPPIVLDNFDGLIIFVNDSSEISLLNYEVQSIDNLLFGTEEKDKVEPVNVFSRYLLDLSSASRISADDRIVKELESLSCQKSAKKYNNFSRIKPLFKE